MPNPHLGGKAGSGPFQYGKSHAADDAGENSQEQVATPLVTSSATVSETQAQAIAYTATSDNSNAKWLITDLDGATNLTIDYDTGVMAGNVPNSGGSVHNIKLYCADVFGVSDEFNLELTVIGGD